MKWFGEPWPGDWRQNGRAPVCEDDAMHVETPVGLCQWCRDPILGTDQGVIVPSVAADLRVTQEPYHVECWVRLGLGGPGHLQGRCLCCGGSEDPDLGMPPRESARWVWRWVQERGG